MARRVGLFLLLTYAWSWSLLGAAWVAEGPAVLVPRLLAGLGPALAAALLLRRTVAVSAQRAFWRRVVDARSVDPRWWLVVIVASAGPAVVVAGRDWRASGATGRSAGSRGWRPSGLLGIVAFALAAGLAEEPGWRGYLLDRLRAGRDGTPDRHGGLSDRHGGVLRLLLWTVPAIVVVVAWVRRPTAAVSASAA
ncbi:MAG TPA: hypothetical protein VK908_12260 [Jiangellales bacterium]|nr:hypothetical protein [Jiangellales bacterium]